MSPLANIQSFMDDATPFFNPNPEFIEWLSPHIDASNQVTIEIGAGGGRLARQLADKKVNIRAIDLFPRTESEFDVLTADATAYRYPRECTVICARPCHSDWVEQAIRLSLETAEVFYYIGLADNIERDLGNILADSKYLHRQVYTNAGSDEEIVIQISNRERDNGYLIKFVLVKYPDNGISWCEDIDGRLYNYSGGFTVEGRGVEVLESCIAHDWPELDWSKTTLRNDNKAEGWLSPSGEFFGCSYMDHDKLARLYLKKETGDLEMEGWCRIVREEEYGDPDLDDDEQPQQESFVDYFFCPQDENLKLTNEQVRWLRSKNIEVKGRNLPDPPQKAYRPTKSYRRPVSGD